MENQSHKPGTFQMPMPCPKSWDSMAQAEGGRRCQNCDKLIVDFRNRPAEDIFSAWKESKGKLCGVFSGKQVDRPFGRFGLARFLMVAVAVFGTFLFNISEAEAQQMRNAVEFRASDEISIPQTSVVEGSLVDKATGEGLIGGTVRVLLGGESTQIGAMADVEGNFRLEIPSQVMEAKEFSLLFTYLGFQEQKLDFVVKDLAPLTRLRVELEESEMMLGMIGIVIQAPMEETNRETPISFSDGSE